MALNALTLSTTQGVQGRPFQAAISGLSTGRIEVLGDASPGFSVVNGQLMSRGLPYPVSTVSLREYEPGVGQGYRDSRIDITATTRDQLMTSALALMGPGRTLVRYRAAGQRQPDGSITYRLYAEDDLGATQQVLIGVPAVRSFGALTATKDGSVGQTYTAPAGMSGIQWYREALSSDRTQTAISGATGSTYTAAAGDAGFRLVAKGNISGVLTDAVAYYPAYAAPVLVDGYDDMTDRSTTNASAAVVAPLVQGAGAIQMGGNGVNNSAFVSKNTRTAYDLATVGNVAVLIDFGTVGDALLQDTNYIGVGLAVSAAGTGTGSSGTIIDGTLSNNPATQFMTGRRWYSQSTDEYQAPQPTGVGISSVRVGWNVPSAFAGKVKVDAQVRNSGGMATIIMSNDDGYIEQYTTFWPAWRDRGLGCTFFPAKNNITAADSGNTPNWMKTAMLQEMYATGLADIGVDPPDDAPLTGDASIAAALAHADAGRQWVLQNGWTRAKDHLCYPNGSCDISTRKLVTDFTANGTAVVTMASTTGLAAGQDVAGLNVPIAAGYKIVSVDSATQVTLNQTIASGTYRVNCAITSAPFFGAKLPQALAGAGWLSARTTYPKIIHDRFGITSDEALTLTAQSMSSQTFADTKKYVDLTVKRGGTLYLYGHRYTNTGGLNYAPSDLLLLADYLKSLSDQGAIWVPTISQWYTAVSQRSFPL